MAASPTITVTERRKGPVALSPESSQSIGGFLGIAERGVPSEVKLCTSYPDFVEQFGNPVSGSYLSNAVQAFFDNGGRKCYVSRAAHYTTISTPSSYDMVAAATTLQDSTPTNTLSVVASSPGTWANSHKVVITRKSIYITSLAVAVPAGANTSATLTSATRVRIGDTLLITDTVDSMTVTVTSINGSVISFASATAAPGQIDTALSAVSLLVFDMKIIDRTGATVREWTNLRMSSLSTQYCVDVVNETYRTPVLLTDLASASVDKRPATTTGTLIGATTAGTDGGTVVDADYAGSSSGKTGVYVFNNKSDFGMLSVPGVTTATVTRALIEYAELRQIFLAVADLPNGTAVSAADAYVNTTVNRFSSFAAYIYPWTYAMVVTDGVSSKTALPTSPFWQGIMARVDAKRGVHKSPAGIDDAQLRGIVSMVTDVQEEDYNTLYPLKVNAVQTFSGYGTAVMGNVTLDTTGEFGQIQVRRYFLQLNFICKTNMRWVNFEPNDSKSRSRAYRLLDGYLANEVRLGRLEDYYVVCDETNNTAYTRSQRKFLVTIGIKVPDSSEFVEFTLEQDTRAIDALLAS